VTGIVLACVLVGVLVAVPILLNHAARPAAPLSASFILDPYPPDVGQNVTFVGSASGGVLPYAYAWNFGDGSVGKNQTAVHSFSSYGAFYVELTVTDSSSAKQTASSTQPVMVLSSPAPPKSSPEINMTFTSSYNNTLEPEGYQPATGDTYLVVHLTIYDDGYANFSANPLFSMYVTVGSNTYNVSIADYIFLQYPFPPTNMTNEQSATGDLVFEVPQGTTSFAPSWRLATGEQYTIRWNQT